MNVSSSSFYHEDVERKMIIGIDGAPLSQIKTGVGHYTFEIARGVATTQPQEKFRVVSHLQFTADGFEDTPPNLEFVRAPVNAFTKHWWTIGLPRYIRQNSIELFHGTNYDIPVWGGCATVLSIHDLSALLYPETHVARRVWRTRRRLPLMARKATRIIVPTESVKSEVCEHLRIDPEKVETIRYAPRRCFQPLTKSAAQEKLKRLNVEDPFILYVGAIEPRKNLLTLVRAFEEIYKNTDLRPQLVIAGPTGWLSDDLFRYVQRSPVQSRMLVTGYLCDEDLRALYSSCTVMCYPALYEGAGLPPLEAMACGAPVITSDAQAIAEMVGDAACLVPAKNYQELARQIVVVATDPKLRSSLIQRGLIRAGAFSWERTAEATYVLYQKALATHGAK
jgi:glycosyltransferase involved in cell wall biosynthesis